MGPQSDQSSDDDRHRHQQEQLPPHRPQCRLWVNYGLRRLLSVSSAFGGKADMNFWRLKARS